ncbi:hypothetical protein BDM02DRAFT_3111679 [Thelephora ganbajun]|uniref:Uncharacterized protein n=1 Tax=Thelephora ganbajun TaxID=370292 RepID=A0ACB6ZM43_THEGA|nr:hypothetical protein BDM02DRAFT_3111679 [Thelephora ganbajun]
MASVQVAIFLYLFFLFTVARSRRVFLIDQSDPNSVTFSGNWSTLSYSSAIGGSYALTSEPAARVSIMLPWGTVAAHYIGFQLQSSTTYSFCVDCVTSSSRNDLVNATSVQVDGTFLNVDERASPLLLFTVGNLDPTFPHVLTVLNPKTQNVITIDAVVVDVLSDAVTSTSNTPTVLPHISTPPPISSYLSSKSSQTPTPTLPPPVSTTPASTVCPSATSTLPFPSTTSQGSGSGSLDKNASLPLIISLTVASAIILVAIFMVHRHVRRPRRDNPIYRSDNNSSREVATRGPSIVVARSRSGSTESNVLPAPALWRTMSPNAGSLPGRFDVTRTARLNSRYVPTPSMMETLQSHTDTFRSIPNDGSNRSHPPNNAD